MERFLKEPELERDDLIRLLDAYADQQAAIAHRRAVVSLLECDEAFFRTGAAWWNGLNIAQRNAAMRRVGRNASVADAYRFHLWKSRQPAEEEG